MSAALEASTLRRVRSHVLEWYRAQRRDLPWRRTRDPYAIWISEVMLQQTRVDTVIPYYERFLERWPSVTALAEADPDDVRAAWSGLGYYRRAETMLKAARIIAEGGGSLPSDPEALGSLPGFGPYTRGAVASIAFDREVPAVDGNVGRVLARIGAIEGDVTKGAPSRAVWRLAEQLAVGEAPGELNQGLIELGALLCKRNPNCTSCPVRDDCRARSQRRTAEIPPPRRRAAPRAERWTALLLHDDTEVVMERRPNPGRFAGLWTPPLFDGAEAPSVGTQPLSSAGEIVHRLTHREMTIGIARGGLPETLPEGWRTVPLEGLDAVGLPTVAAKILRAGLPPELLPATLPGRDRKPAGRQIKLPLEAE
ncbi:MAG: A/G-specific adenine glycosylase [Myxococcota bacterium]